MWERLLQWDRDALIYINGLGHENFDVFWTTVTNFPVWIPLFLVMVFVFILKFSRREAVLQLLLVIALLSFIGLLSNLAKDWSGRLRPNNDEEIKTMIRVLQNPSDYSFFSGHASTSFAVTVLVYLFLRKQWKWALLFFIWPLLFSCSRLYLGVHFPLDVMVGAALGTMAAFLFHGFYHKVIAPYSRSTRP